MLFYKVKNKCICDADETVLFQECIFLYFLEEKSPTKGVLK